MSGFRKTTCTGLGTQKCDIRIQECDVAPCRLADNSRASICCRETSAARPPKTARAAVTEDVFVFMRSGYLSSASEFCAGAGGAQGPVNSLKAPQGTCPYARYRRKRRRPKKVVVTRWLPGRRGRYIVAINLMCSVDI
jgi:hypothetical protein